MDKTELLCLILLHSSVFVLEWTEMLQLFVVVVVVVVVWLCLIKWPEAQNVFYLSNFITLICIYSSVDSNVLCILLLSYVFACAVWIALFLSI